MRRIYESEAIKRDDDEPLSPRERGRDTEPQSFRSISGSAWSDRLLPHVIRKRAVSVRLSAPDQEIEQGTEVPFVITFRNRLPMPVTIKMVSPLLWTWAVDGHQNASHVQLDDPPDETRKLRLDRGERKKIRRNWSGMFRVSEREWTPAAPGQHTIRVEINVDNPARASLVDETTVQIV